MTDWPEPFIRAILTPRGDGLRTLTPPPSCPYPGSRRWRSTVPLVVTAALIVIAAIVWAAAGWAQDSQGRASPYVRLNMLRRR